MFVGEVGAFDGKLCIVETRNDTDSPTCTRRWFETTTPQRGHNAWVGASVTSRYEKGTVWKGKSLGSGYVVLTLANPLAPVVVHTERDIVPAPAWIDTDFKWVWRDGDWEAKRIGPLEKTIACLRSVLGLYKKHEGVTA